jgi:hypothetical protein
MRSGRQHAIGLAAGTGKQTNKETKVNFCLKFNLKAMFMFT